jgi:hypothetical protein
MFRETEEAVNSHLRMAGEEVMGIWAAKEFGFQPPGSWWRIYTDFILRTVEIEARLASPRNI